METTNRFAKLFRRIRSEHMTYTARCSDCGATRRVKVQSGEVNDAGTMMHQPWCSLDMKNITHSVGSLRR
jgi:hypothetical protein